MMTNKDWQKYGERYALTILTDELKIPRDSIIESKMPRGQVSDIRIIMKHVTFSSFPYYI